VFVPEGFEPPTGLVTHGFRLEPLGPEHNESDYAAWSSSIEHILGEMTLDENLADLERHARDFGERTGFTYTVLAGEEVVGCVYVYPAEEEAHDARVRSWVTASRAELDGALRQAVADWLTGDAWPFERPMYEPLLG
jgi:hypothetical protein